VAEDVRDGNAVCYGIAADLLSLERKQVLRIGLQVSHRFRRLQAQEHLKLNDAEAEKYLNESDQKRRRWLAYLFGSTAELPLGFDLIINLEQMSVDTAYTAVFEMILHRNRLGTTDPAPLKRFELSSRIKAAFALDPRLRMSTSVWKFMTARLYSVVPCAASKRWMPSSAYLCRSLQA